VPVRLVEDDLAQVPELVRLRRPWRARVLIENIREIYPDTPVVLTSPGLELSWEEDTGPHAVTALRGQPTGARLHAAIEAALGNTQTEP